MTEGKYKTFWRRLSAGLIDGVIFLPLGYIDESLWNHSENISSAYLFTWFIFSSSAYLIYSVLLHGSYGQTIGKKISRVKVLDISENKLTMQQAILRDSVPIVLTIIPIIYETPNILQKINPYKRDLGELFDIQTIILSSIGSLWFLIEIITMLTNAKRRAVHDFIAKSVVLHYA